MGSKELSNEEQLNLRNSARAELERLEAIQANANIMQLLDRFKAKFNICETVYKVILSEHQKKKGNIAKKHLTLDMRQVPHALAFAGYHFDKELLTELFGAKSSKGKTLKKLRDSVTHGLDELTINEIVQRNEELFGYMDDFLNVIRTFDLVTES